MKSVNFYGPDDEFIVSGSDCGNIFLWSKETSAIVNMFHGDEGGVVRNLLCDSQLKNELHPLHFQEETSVFERSNFEHFFLSSSTFFLHRVLFPAAVYPSRLIWLLSREGEGRRERGKDGRQTFALFFLSPPSLLFKLISWLFQDGKLRKGRSLTFYFPSSFRPFLQRDF